MEYLTNEEAVEVIKNNTKAWFKRNWKKVLFVSIVGGAFAQAAVKSKGKSMDLNVKTDNENRIDYSDIDEAIFTGIAPLIEDYLLEEGLDEAVIDETFEVPYPKGGDISNGIYTVLKNVHVSITDMCEEVN